MKEKIIFGIIIILIFITINSTVFATTVQSHDRVEVASTDLGLGDLDDYKGTSSTSETLVSKASNILGIIQVVGIVVSVVMLMAIGIKYMLGSVEEKAEYKSSLKPYIIGAFVLFTGTTVPNIIYKIMQGL